jgi:SAM-dependent methyltransferase/shikimate kinase
MIQSIILLGANGSSKSTIGRELAHMLNFAHFDVEDYWFYKTDIPYTVIRPQEERNMMLLSDMKKHGSFVVSGDISGWSEEFLTMFDLAVFLTAPTEIRMKRIENREYARWGDRVCRGGDMYESQKKFREFAAKRDVGLLERRALEYSCPVVYYDSTRTPGEIVNEILTYINTLNHYDALIDENNDPVHDPAPIKAYMDKWDGEVFIEALLLSPDKPVLEIGVGTGRLAMRVCDKCKHFTGIDISQKTLQRAKANLQRFSNIDLICGDFLTYPFSERFDIIYTSLTFMHIQDKRAAIRKVASLLKPGGRFVLSIDKNQQTEINFGNRRIIVYPDTPEEITALIVGAGLTIEKQFETEFAVIFVATKEV